LSPLSLSLSLSPSLFTPLIRSFFHWRRDGLIWGIYCNYSSSDNAMIIYWCFLIFKIHTHYIHSVVVQDFVSGRACCVNQYHYESRQRRVLIRLVHATGKTWYKVLYKHTMYVISLSNISININFKQITRVEIRLTNLYNTLRKTAFCAWHHICCRSFYCFVNVAHIDVFYPTFQWYDVMTK
jgi:hypothetical protein